MLYFAMITLYIIALFVIHEVYEIFYDLEQERYNEFERQYDEILNKRLN